MKVEQVFKEICGEILDIQSHHPVRVAVDGITASGKSTFAKNLVRYLDRSNRKVIYTTLDGFHNPRKIRHQRGRSSPEGYYFDAYNFDAVLQELLKPLGPGGSLCYATEVFDLQNDEPLEIIRKLADPKSILVVDGSFALRKELVGFWDYKIYLKAEYDVAVRRAAIRDRVLFGSAEEAARTTKLRYHGAHKIHFDQADPISTASRVVNNNNPLEPEFVPQVY